MKNGNTVQAQSIGAGCTSSDMQKLGTLGRGLMTCYGTSLPEVFMFMRSMSTQQHVWLDHCSESTDRYQSDCIQLLESLSQQAATQPNSLPAKIVANVYDNPPKVSQRDS